MVERVFKMLD
jgi:calcyphosin